MSTSCSLLTPAQLQQPPDLAHSRPTCCPRCDAVPAQGRIGLHGDGIKTRWVTITAVVDQQATFIDVRVAFRRFWCPLCRQTCLVGHPEIVARISVAVTTLAAAVHQAAQPPLGHGIAEIELQRQIQGNRATPSFSERARSGRPRWHALRRWVRTLERFWPTLTLAAQGFHARLSAFVAAIGPGLPIAAFLQAAVQAKLRGGIAM